MDELKTYFQQLIVEDENPTGQLNNSGRTNRTQNANIHQDLRNQNSGTNEPGNSSRGRNTRPSQSENANGGQRRRNKSSGTNETGNSSRGRNAINRPSRPENAGNGQRRRNQSSGNGTNETGNSSRGRNPITGPSRSENANNFQRDRNRKTGEQYPKGRGSNECNLYSGKKSEKMPYKMSFRLLQDMLAKDVDEVVEILMNDRIGFKKTLKDENLSGDLIVLIVKILKQISKTAFVASKINIFNMVLIDSTFAKQLRLFVLNLPYHQRADKRKNSFFWEDTDAFWLTLVEVIDETMKIPTLASEVLPILLKSIIQTLPILITEQSMSFPAELLEKMIMLQTAVENIKTTMTEKYQPVRSNVKNPECDEDNLDPPNDFRQISIYPDITEITSRDKPFLRKNKIKGPYMNVEHYLDVQFRLLREDFIAPLRNGICQYIEDPKKKRYDDIKIHREILFLNEENVNEMKCFRIKFDFSKKKKSLKYENSKQFMYGSLVCFTKDRFQNVIFARIVKRDPDIIKRGEIIVGFDYDVEISYREMYVMVESSVYFEPYYHVLTVLQGIRGDEFPLERYIIYANSNVYPPKFLAPHTAIRIAGHNLSLMHWPQNLNIHNFNESQNIAFIAALTHELSVIQGPPGTGKTYVGLKIIKTLLCNSDIWFNRSPILVICFTNHALDQFLEGIIETTQRIVRVGSQSKNENLNRFNLNQLKRGKKSGNYYQLMNELKATLNDLKYIDKNIALLNKNDRIVEFSYFYNIPNYRNTWFFNAKNKDIEKWLLEKAISARTDEQSYLKSDAPGTSNDTDSDTDDELTEYSDHEEEVDEIFTNVLFADDRYLVSLPYLSLEIQGIEKSLQNPELEHERIKNETQLWELKQKYDYVKKKLAEYAQSPGKWCTKKPYDMTEHERWSLYKYCCTHYLDDLRTKRTKTYVLFQQVYKLYSDARAMDDLKLLRENLVIGMTTTSAARLRTSLETLRSPIVIVEEAAEVLESHITSALTRDCNQLILIGDHQQLKPTTANYRVEKEFKMGVSLFERLINNNVQCHTLNIQHRMRPEICDLIRPAIYPDLKDHDSVKNRPNIKGVEKHLFFLHHAHMEEVCGDTSKKNIHEAKLLIHLAKYLILNGYSPSDITILAAYLGQMFEMQRERNKYSFIMKDVRISVLDNYQGEESNIILLSLVRNNKENVNGFLKIENRVCVALSRARNGLYIMGNIDQLCNDTGTVWLKIRETLEEQKALGTYLELRCQIHKKITNIITPEDFHKVPEGGCDSVCNAKLACGHMCKNICHIEDRDHQKYNCREKCGKNLCDINVGHICIDQCFMECRPCYYPIKYELECGHEVTLECHVDVETYACIEPVLTELPCGHSADKPCHLEIDNFPCPHPCDTRVEPCGHACTLKCHTRNDPDHCDYKCSKPCVRYRKGCSTQEHLCTNLCYQECEPCTFLVMKPRTVCPHFDKVSCNEDVDAKECKKPCEKILDCNHKCRNLCHESCGPCKIKILKIIPECGHDVMIMCHVIPGLKDCKKNCNKTLLCGHHCIKKCKDPCTTQCEELKACNLPSPCGHMVTSIKCHENLTSNDKQLLKYCTQPCDAILKCGHKCRGTCSGCLQGRFHMRCMEKCGVPLICNHLCPVPCRKACKPCEELCNYLCKHSKCQRKCGDICVPCKEECPRSCVHQQCKNKCGDICSVPPCKEPCDKSLECGHRCVGHCSDPCPKLCRICDETELTEIFFGTEDDENARFVELQDCNHIFESEGLENWLSGDGEIQAKVCPRCKTLIVKTQRYSDYIKNALADVNKVKKQLNGSTIENGYVLRNLQQQITLMQQTRLGLVGVISIALVSIKNRLLPIVKTRENDFKRQNINKIILNSLKSKIQVLENLLKICEPLSRSLPPEVLHQLDLILNCLLRDQDQITEQEIEDIQMETLRFKRIVEIAKIRGLNFSAQFYNKNFQNICEAVLTFVKYSEQLDDDIKTKLEKLNCGIQISEGERMEIVRAMGLAKGHWFKCPNGHPYYIDDCGGAMVEANCNECGARIGGSHHTLLSTNGLATEMDGATYAAWSEAANMNNYQF